VKNYFHKLAKDGARMPIGTDLVLAEKPDHAAIKLDGEQLGRVMEESAKRWKTPVAMPLMDLTVEKEWLLTALGISVDQAHVITYHFDHDLPSKLPHTPLTPRIKANADAIRYIVKNTDLLPCGMSIGPFSLMTKLINDPITSVYIAGTGEKDEEVEQLEKALDLSLKVVLHLLRSQIEAGAKAIVVCEPAANATYFSPNQLATGADIFDRYVIRLNKKISDYLRSHNVGLIFHDCGELTFDMIRQFNALEPVMLSLGSAVRLWEDAKFVSPDIVLYGNLPSKQFYSDEVMPVSSVKKMARELLARMKETKHRFILGSECDVLSVPGHHATITAKVDAFLNV
jgi:uroporphyrinogen-III decarboxylase